MSEERFKELVSLFLDNEISPEEVSDLEQEISADPARREQFARCCRLDHAMRRALSSSCEEERRSAVTPFSVSAVVFGGAIAAAFVFGTVLVPALERMMGVPESGASLAAAEDSDFTENSYRMRRGVVESNSSWMGSAPRPEPAATAESWGRTANLHVIRFSDGRAIPVYQPDVEQPVLSVSEFSLHDLLNLPQPEPAAADHNAALHRIPEPAIQAAVFSIGPGGL